MTRLTNDIREHIGRAAIKAAFDPRGEELAKAEDALCREAFAFCYTADEIKKAKALPDYWLRRDPCLRFVANGMRITLCTLADHHLIPYASKRTGRGGYDCHADHGAIADQDLADRIVAHARAKESLREERDNAERKLMSLINRFSTVKKLADAWPEGAPFYQRYLENPDALPPAVRFDDVNAALGIGKAA